MAVSLSRSSSPPFYIYFRFPTYADQLISNIRRRLPNGTLAQTARSDAPIEKNCSVKTSSGTKFGCFAKAIL
jgi:hypothetical protein